MKRPFLPSLALPGLAFASLAVAAAATQAAPGDAVEHCVDLAPEHQIVRSGGSTHFLLKSGNDHYKVAFQRSCGSLYAASRVTISAEGVEGRLCPGTGVVATRPSAGMVATSSEQCAVGAVTRIESEEFSRQQRRRR